MHADYISPQHKGIKLLRFLYIKRAFIMITGCFYGDMHVLPVESCVYALCMNISDLFGELQYQAHPNHSNLKMQKILFPFCQEDAFFAMHLHVMQNIDMHAPDKA